MDNDHRLKFYKLHDMLSLISFPWIYLMIHLYVNELPSFTSLIPDVSSMTVYHILVISFKFEKMSVENAYGL